MKENISSQRVDSPAALDRYIRVTPPAVWVVLGIIALLLIAALVWAVFGTVEKTNEDGSKEEVHPIVFITN